MTYFVSTVTKNRVQNLSLLKTPNEHRGGSEIDLAGRNELELALRTQSTFLIILP